jgi:predicted protein tyrosine phosphatase
VKILVTDRNGIEKGIDIKSNYIVISIHDSDSRPAKVKKQPGLRAVLPLGFDNVDPTGPTKLVTSVAMTPEQADAIWNFVDEHRDEVGALVVHCEAGHSRSPAVAAAICEVLGGDGRRFFTGKEPNMYVYRLMLRAAGKSTGS